MQDMRDLYKAYSAVHDTTIKEELDNSKDQISEMNFAQLTESDLIEVCEEIVEGMFKYGCELDQAYDVIGTILEGTTDGNIPELRKEKIVRIAEAFDKTLEKVSSRAERNCEEEFLKYRSNKPLNEKWQNKLNNEVGNEKLHAALIHEDREIIKLGLVEIISGVMEEWEVTNADKKGNTPAYQAYKSGKKNAKTGKPMYKAAAGHLKSEGYKPYPKEKVDKQKEAAYNKEMAARGGKKTDEKDKEADKQYERRIAMDFKQKIRKEDVEFSEAEKARIQEIVASWED